MRRSGRAVSLGVCVLSLVITAGTIHPQTVDPNPPTGARFAADPARVREALAALEKLVDRYRKTGDRASEARGLAAVAASYDALHQQQKAVEELQAALVIWRQLGDKDHEATVLAHIGDVFRLWGFPEQANRYYRDALVTYPSSDKAGRGATLNNLSLTWFSLNNRKRCIDSLDDALAIFRELQDRRGEALALANLGAAYVYLVNDPMKAVGVFQEALTKLEILNDRDSQAGVLDKMGVAWHNLGKSEMAGLSFQHALELYRSAGDPQGEAAVRKHMRMLGEQQSEASTQ